MTEGKDFVDELKHPGVDRHREIVDAFDDTEVEDFVDKLFELIDEDPFFFDPYLTMVELFEEAELYDESAELMEKAYEIAVQLITAKNGRWPAKLRWGFVENRHIIKTLTTRGVLFWKNDRKEEALNLFNRLLRMNPNDNGGNRFLILGIKMGMDFRGFMDRFDRGGYFDNEINEWFNEHYSRFPAEFGWWDEATEV